MFQSDKTRGVVEVCYCIYVAGELERRSDFILWVTITVIDILSTCLRCSPLSRAEEESNDSRCRRENTLGAK